MTIDPEVADFLDSNNVLYAYDRSAGKKHSLASEIVADLAEWRLHSPKASDLLLAIDLKESHPLAFWDAQVIQSAASLGCTQLISEDLNHGQVYGSVQVINPVKELE